MDELIENANESRGFDWDDDGMVEDDDQTSGTRTLIGRDVFDDVDS